MGRHPLNQMLMSSRNTVYRHTQKRCFTSYLGIPQPSQGDRKLTITQAWSLSQQLPTPLLWFESSVDIYKTE